MELRMSPRNVEPDRQVAMTKLRIGGSDELCSGNLRISKFRCSLNIFSCCHSLEANHG